MRIGIDIDGVLTDVEQWQLGLGSKIIFEQCNKGIINADRYDINEIFDVEKNIDGEDGKKMRNIVINWLKENNISYDKIIISPEEKIDICLENNIDLML